MHQRVENCLSYKLLQKVTDSLQQMCTSSQLESKQRVEELFILWPTSERVW